MKSISNRIRAEQRSRAKIYWAQKHRLGEARESGALDRDLRPVPGSKFWFEAGGDVSELVIISRGTERR